MVRKIAENYRLPYYTISPTYSVCRDHGYLAGEQFTCPHCGGETEVYSRITGYYRPVKNWNDGKAQEYKERKVYDVFRAELDNHERDGLEKGKILLFTTKRCPNCKIAAAILEKANVSFTKIEAEERPDLAKEYGVLQAPTLIVLQGDETERYCNASEIQKYVDENQPIMVS